jgi:hypothetical protein
MEQDDDIRPVKHQTSRSGGELPDFNVWFILKDITGKSDNGEPSTKESSKLSKFVSKVKHNIPNAGQGSMGDLLVVPIRMENSEYKKYFAVDEESGQFLSGVTSPTCGRRAWLQDRLDEQKPKERNIREVCILYR